MIGGLEKRQKGVIDVGEMGNGLDDDLKDKPAFPPELNPWAARPTPRHVENDFSNTCLPQGWSAPLGNFPGRKCNASPPLPAGSSQPPSRQPTNIDGLSTAIHVCSGSG